ncbi:MAG: protein kinase [Candidatus Sericytochromatia bacterium]
MRVDLPGDADNPLDLTPLDESEAFVETVILAQDHISSESGEQALAGESPRSHYDFLGMLGKGAMGLVHLARDRDLQRKVAYKQLLGKDNSDATARFLREAQITAQLDHPNIVPIYGMEAQSDGSLAYSMKLVQGKTFKELMAETRAFYDQGQQPDIDHDLSQLLENFLKVCDAVAYAHNKGVIHRDLKPANLMLGRYNEVYVMDWGIARVMREDPAAQDKTAEDWILPPLAEGEELGETTQMGQILGTPRYMSPQQAAGKNAHLDGRSDLFALGLILFELITLKPAFTAKSQVELLKKVLKADKEPWRAYAPSRKIPTELMAIVDKATERKPEKRYDSVRAFSDDLRRYLRGEAPLVRPDNAWRRGVRWVGRHRELSLMVILSVLLCASGAVIWELGDRQHKLEVARLREGALLKFMARISAQGQRLDSHFQQMEGLVQGLAEATTYALTQGESRPSTWYLNDTFAKPPRKRFHPPDLIHSPYYEGEISPNWPVYLLSPGVSAQSVAPLLHRVAPLRSALKTVLMKSLSPGKPLSESQWKTQLTLRGVPVIWAYICLKEGIEYFYPGAEETADGYEPRTRSYYLQSLNRHEIVWGTPYDDTGETGGLMIPCTRGIFDAEQQFLGVVGLDIRINVLDRAFLRLGDVPAVKTSYLLNEAGNVILRSGDALKPKRRLGLHEKLITKPYHNGEVVKAIRAKSNSGKIAGESKQGERLTVYYRLSSLGWYFVVEADPRQVFAPTQF